jgi:hypothetical protein
MASMKRLFMLVPLAVASSANSSAFADLKATIVPRWTASQPLTPNHTGCLFADDAVAVVVSDGGKGTIEEDLCSSYGRATARIVVDGKARKYVLVEYHEGRGPNATTGYLTVYRLAGEMREVARIPLSWATGPAQRFTYKFKVATDELGGLRISLRDTAPTSSECCIPGGVQTIRIDGE